MNVQKVSISLEPMAIKDRYYREAIFNGHLVPVDDLDYLQKMSKLPIKYQMYQVHEVRFPSGSKENYLVPIDKTEIFNTLIQITDHDIKKIQQESQNVGWTNGWVSAAIAFEGLSWWRRLFRPTLKAVKP